MRALVQRLKAAVWSRRDRWVRRWLARQSDDHLAVTVGDVLDAVVRDRPSDAALRLLLRLDAEVYRLTGRAAVACEGGVHPKHRLTRYADFFVQRLAAGERVLDVGCGPGLLARAMAERAGAIVTGVEVNAERLDQARRTNAHERVTYVLSDATECLPEGRFDVVVLSNVLEHIGDRVGLLRRIQVAHEPSRWLIRVPLLDRDWRVPLKRELGLEWRLDPEHQVEYTEETLDRELAEAGLTIAYRQTRWGELWVEAIAAGQSRAGHEG
jgi:SAM-dependent methyltransferase